MSMRPIIAVAGILAFLLLFGCAGGPSSATAKQVAGGIQVSWSPADGAAGYAVYRSTDAASAGIRMNSALIVGETSYTDTSVRDGVTYYYTVRSVDASGKENGGATASATAKVAPPAGLTVSINQGATYTTDKSVTLYLSATSASQCRFSNDGSTWSDWEPYATIKAWTLPGEDGPKDVYYQCADAIGNNAQPATASIYLDTQPPKLSLFSPVMNGQYSGSFVLDFTVTDDADPAALTATCTGAVDSSPIAIGVVDIGKEISMTVYSQPGSHMLHIECADKALNTSQTVTFTVNDKPSVSLSLGDGAGYTASTTVPAHITAKAQDCRLSNDGVTWGSWFPYTDSKQWTLTPGDGTKTVYAQCRSGTGAVSDTAQDTIVLDTSPPPYISVSINNDARWTNSRNVLLGLYAFAASQCRFSNDDMAWSGWEPYTTSRAWTLTAGEGTKTVYYNCQKRTGDDAGTASASITYSEVQPDPPSGLDVTINNGDEYTTSTKVTLRLSADGANECRVGQDGYGWNGWMDYISRVTFSLQGPDGEKTVNYQCRNDYGTRSTYGTIYLVTQPPPKITNLQASAGEDSIYLSWSRPSGSVVSYSIYRSDTSLGLFALLTTTRSVSYIDSGAAPGATYAYSVRSNDVAGQQSADSNIVTASIDNGLAQNP